MHHSFRSLIGRLSLLSLFALVFSCTFVQEQYPYIPPGPYRAVLKLENNFPSPNPKGEPLPEKMNLEFEEVTEGELPFTFTAHYNEDSTFYLELKNGSETITVPPENIHYGRDQVQGRDTIRIDFPIYDTYISAYHEAGIIEGVWIVNYRENYRIPFLAEFGQDHRFTKLRKEPSTDLGGEWAMEFTDTDGDFPALGEFKQEGNYLTGTIRTETGDYRFLEGTVQANKFYLSVFDGSHAFLFEGLIKEDGTLSGSFRSGRHYLATFTARREEGFALANPDSLTFLRDDAPLSFSFATAEGDTVRLSDPEYTGKPKLIQIMGTWCPNCRDEAEFLKKWKTDNPTVDIPIIALAFERYGPEDDRSRAAIRRYIDNMDIDWPVLLAGNFEKEDAARALPMLNHIFSFPTLLFLDADNRVVRINTGFNGPATSTYATFVEGFEATINTLKK